MKRFDSGSENIETILKSMFSRSLNTRAIMKGAWRFCHKPGTNYIL